MLSPNEIYHLSAVDLLSQLDDHSVDLILTDPPYGVRYDSGKQSYFGEIAGDDKLPTNWLTEAYRVLKSGSAIYIYSHWRTFGEMKDAVERVGFTAKNMIVLKKSNHGMGDTKGGYAPKHELILYAQKDRHILSKTPPAYKRLPDVIDVPILHTRRHRHHPCEKPISWHLPFILGSSQPGDLVVDPFTGSGSVPLACVESGRNFIAGDIDGDCVCVAKARCNSLSISVA